MLWLQQQVGEGGFWIVMVVVAAAVIGVGIVFRRKHPPQ